MLNKIEEAGSSKATFFELLGGEENGVTNIRALVEAFYDIMDADPKATGIRALHPQDLTSAREKLFMFLTGWTGGPQLYIQRYGHPRLRARHMPFAIGEMERDQWMCCMIEAMKKCNFDEKIMVKLAEQLYGVADFMRNRADQHDYSLHLIARNNVPVDLTLANMGDRHVVVLDASHAHAFLRAYYPKVAIAYMNVDNEILAINDEAEKLSGYRC